MKRITLLFVCFAFSAVSVFAQGEEETPEKWDKGFAVGLDFAQLLQINPKVGAGQNRIGFGGALSYFANMKQGRHAWDNSVSWQIGVQRLGAGYYRAGSDEGQPFQKQIDLFRAGTKYGYSVTSDKKWYAATELTFQSQIFPTYPGNLLSDREGPSIAKFFSPATVTYSVGIDYKPNENWSFYYSPIAMKIIHVADERIANTGAHGNPIESFNIDGTPNYGKTLFNLGSLLKINYQNKFGEDKDGNARIIFTSFASFYYDYLQGKKKDDNPEYKNHVDVEWGTETKVNIWKGLGITLTTNLFYDWDVPVQETDWEAVGGVTGNTVHKASFTQQLLISYNITF